MISVTVIFESGFCSIKRFKDTECRSGTVSAAAKQVSELKGQLDNYGAFYVNKLYGGTKELASGTSEFPDKTSDMDTRVSDEIDSLRSSVTLCRFFMRKLL